jgi:hypothetical protein
MRLTTTIPGAGIEKAVKLTGASIIVENSGVYSRVDQVPFFAFNPGSNNNPIYPRSVYVNSEGGFNSIIITGTEESAGDEVTFFTVDECLTTDLNINLNETVEAEAGTTSEEVLSDAVFEFDELSILNAEGKLPKRVYLSSADENIHYTFNVDPEQDSGTLFHNLGAPGNNKRNTPLQIEGINFILSIRFINATNATDSTLVYTFEY